MLAGHMVVVKMDGVAGLCKTDEVGELCLAAPYGGQGYWGLDGITNNQFKVLNNKLSNNFIHQSKDGTCRIRLNDVNS